MMMSTLITVTIHHNVGHVVVKEIGGMSPGRLDHFVSCSMLFLVIILNV